MGKVRRNATHLFVNTLTGKEMCEFAGCMILAIRCPCLGKKFLFFGKVALGTIICRIVSFAYTLLGESYSVRSNVVVSVICSVYKRRYKSAVRLIRCRFSQNKKQQLIISREFRMISCSVQFHYGVCRLTLRPKYSHKENR